MATDSQIMFAGNILPCVVERFPEIKKAARKYRRYSIPGRNGDIFFQDDAWENVSQSYDVYSGSDTYGSQIPWTELAMYLYKDGYQELSDTYDPDHFRKAVFNNQVQVENSWNTHGRATLEFDCRPERFRYDGLQKISYANTDNKLAKVDYDDLNADLQVNIGYLADWYWVLTIPANSTATIGTFYNDEDVATQSVYAIPAGTESTSQTATAIPLNGQKTVDYTVTSSVDILVPPEFVDGLPQTIVNGVGVGTAGTLNNPYMPAHPTIVLKRLSTHAGEVVAAHINNRGIRIAGGVLGSTYYYFIDTENWEITRSYNSITAARVVAPEATMDPGLQLDHGMNQIYTSTQYEMTLVPNFWEL